MHSTLNQLALPPTSIGSERCASTRPAYGCCVCPVTPKLCLVVLPVAIVFVAVIEVFYTSWPLFFAAILIAFAYCTARFILFGLIVLPFWSLPDGVYNGVDWTWAESPHWH